MARVLKSDDMNKCLGCFTCQRVCAGINHKSFSDAESAIKVRTLGGLSSGKFFATHCFACEGERACVTACPAGALTERKGGGALLVDWKCIKCGKCAAACIVKAIHFAGENTLPIICKHCGICAKYCPHQCLKMEERPNA
jgi:Fe-S-cluster-containing hydrogenase component 2